MKYLLSFLIIPALLFSSCTKESEEIVRPEEEASLPDPGSEDYKCPSGDAGEIIDGQYIVLMKKTPGIMSREDFYRNRVQGKLDKSNIPREAVIKTYQRGVNGFAARMSARQASSLRSDPDVIRVEEDRIVKLSPSEREEGNSIHETQLLPWGVKRTGYGAATGRTVWILDTGVDTDHPDLNVDKNMSTSFVCSDPSAEDYNGHGTHVAGTIAAKDNGFGVVGVAPGTRIVSVKVMNYDGEGAVSDILQGLEYIYNYATRGDVVNMSISGGDVDILDDYVNEISRSKRILFAIAAGNESADSDLISPQRVNNEYVFTISAMDNQDSYASFSNWGTSVDYACPGVKIPSTYLDGEYVYMSGTSMAAPHFAGLLLLNGKDVQVDGNVKNDPDGSPDPIAVMVCR